MDKKFLIKFATKNLLSHKLRAFLTIMAMIIGVSAIVFLVSFAFGLQRLVEKEITGGNAYELIDVGTGNSQIIRLNKDSIKNINTISDIKEIEIIVNAAAKIKNDVKENMDVSFFGTTAKYMDWSGFSVIVGSALNQEKYSPSFNEIVDQKAKTEKKILINETLAKSLNYVDNNDALGKKIKMDVVIPKEITGNHQSRSFVDQDFLIIGVIKGDSGPTAYMDLNNFVNYKVENFSQAKIQVNSADNISLVRKQIENLGFKTEYVGETISQVNQVFSLFRTVLGSFGFVALIVASLGMFNTLTISLLERTKEIALMKMLGIRKKDVMSIFLTESVIMAIFGGIFGIVAGFLLGDLANIILNRIAINAGGEAVQIFYYPFWFIVIIFAFSIIVGFLTGIYPAKRATKVDALNVMRYE